MSRKKARPRDFFIYKIHPFRPLYMGGLDFRPAHPQLRPMLWLIRDRGVARDLSRLNKAQFAPLDDYSTLASGRIIPHSLENLA